MEESSKVRDVLQKIESLPKHEGNVDVQAFLHLYDELVANLKSLGEPGGSVRTDQGGHFTAKNLRGKQKYLVLAIDWDRGDEDEVAYYRYQYIELPASGSRDVEIYMGRGKKTDCRAT
jgi:hypothetical protein